MNQRQWRESGDPKEMLEHVWVDMTPRQLRLFSCACCRELCWDLIAPGPGRRAVEIAERHADGLAEPGELDAAMKAVRRYTWELEVVVRHPGPFRHPEWSADLEWKFPAAQAALAATCERPYPFDTTHAVSACVQGNWPLGRYRGPEYLKAFGQAKAKVTRLLRDVFGNPFRPLTLEPNWLTGTVVSLARAIYEVRTFADLPILADALEDAGCNNEEILSHCRRWKGPHVRGCWVLDRILGKG